jgi:ATP-dependent HslUV protease ATP-binding subunit HslU
MSSVFGRAGSRLVVSSRRCLHRTPLFHGKGSLSTIHRHNDRNPFTSVRQRYFSEGKGTEGDDAEDSVETTTTTTDAAAGGVEDTTADSSTSAEAVSAASGAEGVLPSETEAVLTTSDELTPREIVKALDQYIVGQEAAKKAVAIALRNRYRRHKLPKDFVNEVAPKNILVIGPTGCGKTEVARRVAKLTTAPFIKVEATKFTEVGYHGRDVDSIIKDLVHIAIKDQTQITKNQMSEEINRQVEDIILTELIGEGSDQTTEGFRVHLREGLLEDQTITVEEDAEPKKPAGVGGQQQMVFSIVSSHLMANNGRKTKRRMKVSEARKVIAEQLHSRMVSDEAIAAEAIKRVENDGIVFLDEIDKICRDSHARHSNSGASDEGVQKDLLPLIEGTVVNTDHGNVNTNHILFVCSGAFSTVKPSDLLAELQGRLPIRVELKALTEAELLRVLTDTKANLVEQNVQLLKT